MSQAIHELPDETEMRRAFAAKNPAYDGTFFVAVRTTGVFCRPVCRAKPPRAENIEFFPTAQAALRRGYRACKLCRPLEPAGAQPALVRRLLDLVEASPMRRVTGDDLRELGVDPSTARRQFLAHCGTSFAGYQRARRLGTAVREMRTGRSAAFAGVGAGFQSDSAFRNAVERTFGLSTSRVGGSAILTSAWLPTPLGNMLAVAHDNGIVLLDFADRATLEPTIATLRARFAAERTDAVIVPGEHRHLTMLATELTNYFAGAGRMFTVPICPAGTDFERRAWDALRAIPFGQTRSYGQQAASMGDARADRADGRNTINILIPCHRVIAASGDLTGYGGGLARKRWLLRHEQRIAADSRHFG
jgi:AraC family transcriptional regulator, regulatory protein of adaptative response / methylated-DNA-[protein]-cysteine methyltransferase